MLDQILNPSLSDAAAMLAVLGVGIFAAAVKWFPKSGLRAKLEAEQAAADRRDRGRQIRAELYRGGR